MGYNLWSSEDIAYTLSHRMGVDSKAGPATHETHAEESTRLTEVDADRIELLMAEVALRLDTQAHRLVSSAHRRRPSQRTSRCALQALGD